MKKDLTLIAAVLDRSGSMQSIARDMEGGLFSLIQDQQKEPGECRITLAQFDDQYEVIADYVDAKSITTPYRLIPRNMTALNDAIGKTITSVGQRLAAQRESDRPEHVIFVIITDGMENASQEWTQPAVASLVKEQQEKYNWQFIYLGANQDAMAVGATYNFEGAAVMDWAANPVATSNVYASASASIRSVRETGNAVNFNEADREAAVETDNKTK